MNETNKSTGILLNSLLVGVSLIVMLLPFLPVPEEKVIGYTAFLGRFHPLILHFPIVLVLLLGLAEIGRIFQIATINNRLIGFLLWITVISSFLTVMAGFFLYRSDDYQGAIIQNHFWGGVGISLAANLGLILFRRFQLKAHKQQPVFYQIVILIAVAITAYTSHMGGSITHGSNFLSEPLAVMRAKNEVERKAPQDMLVYGDIIQPFLEDKCLSCHNPYKTKGGLLMNSLANLLKGGKSQKPILVPNDPAASELFHRITLPLTDDEHMPPKEKPGLTDDEITLLRWWINEGADEEMLLGLNPPDSIATLMQQYLPKLFRSERLKLQREKEQQKLAEELATFGEKLNLVIEPDPDGFFMVSMEFPPKAVDDNTIRKLLKYGDLFSKISLPGSEITDDALYDISRMPNLRQLYLPKTLIKGEGLIYLKNLQELEAINLSHSSLSNEHLLHLNQLPAIQEFYLFGTAVDSLVLFTMKEHLPDVEVLWEEGPYY